MPNYLDIVLDHIDILIKNAEFIDDEIAPVKPTPKAKGTTTRQKSTTQKSPNIPSGPRIAPQEEIKPTSAYWQNPEEASGLFNAIRDGLGEEFNLNDAATVIYWLKQFDKSPNFETTIQNINESLLNLRGELEKRGYGLELPAYDPKDYNSVVKILGSVQRYIYNAMKMGEVYQTNVPELPVGRLPGDTENMIGTREVYEEKRKQFGQAIRDIYKIFYKNEFLNEIISNIKTSLTVDATKIGVEPQKNQYLEEGQEELQGQGLQEYNIDWNKWNAATIDKKLEDQTENARIFEKIRNIIVNQFGVNLNAWKSQDESVKSDYLEKLNDYITWKSLATSIGLNDFAVFNIPEKKKNIKTAASIYPKEIQYFIWICKAITYYLTVNPNPGQQKGLGLDLTETVGNPRTNGNIKYIVPAAVLARVYFDWGMCMGMARNAAQKRQQPNDIIPDMAIRGFSSEFEKALAYIGSLVESGVLPLNEDKVVDITNLDFNAMMDVARKNLYQQILAPTREQSRFNSGQAGILKTLNEYRQQNNDIEINKIDFNNNVPLQEFFINKYSNRLKNLYNNVLQKYGDNLEVIPEKFREAKNNLFRSINSNKPLNYYLSLEEFTDNEEILNKINEFISSPDPDIVNAFDDNFFDYVRTLAAGITSLDQPAGDDASNSLFETYIPEAMKTLQRNAFDEALVISGVEEEANINRPKIDVKEQIAPLLFSFVHQQKNLEENTDSLFELSESFTPEYRQSFANVMKKRNSYSSSYYSFLLFRLNDFYNYKDDAPILFNRIVNEMRSEVAQNMLSYNNLSQGSNTDRQLWLLVNNMFAFNPRLPAHNKHQIGYFMPHLGERDNKFPYCLNYNEQQKVSMKLGELFDTALRNVLVKFKNSNPQVYQEMQQRSGGFDAIQALNEDLAVAATLFKKVPAEEGAIPAKAPRKQKEKAFKPIPIE